MRRRLLCEQRGAISVLAGISLIFVIGSAAMTVDVGHVAWQKRSLQRVVDLVSLDAVRAVGDRYDALADPYARALQFAQQSAVRNEFQWNDTASGNSLAIELGYADGATKVFTPLVSPYTNANAVRVTATHRADHKFMPGSVVVENVAVAMNESEATFSIGSRLASINTTDSALMNSVLAGMLGGAVNLDVVSYQGLAAGSVRLGDIWTELGLGTSDQILNSDVNFRDFLYASADALNNQGDPASVNAATILGTLATQIDANTEFQWGDLLSLATGDPGDAANATLNVLEMVGMAATVANGTNLVNLSLPINIPGVASNTFRMSVIEPPVIASGPARQDGSGNWVTNADTAQVRIQMNLTLVQRLQVLLSQGVVTLPVYMEAAGAHGDLTQIRCADPTSNSDITVRTTTHAVTGRIGTITDATLTDGSVPADVRDALLVNMAGLVRVTGRATASIPGSITDLLIPLLQTRSAGGGSAGNVTLDDQLLANLSLTVQVLGLGVNAGTVANDLLAILNPVINILDTSLFTPLKRALSSLGIEVGGADVTNLDESCSGRRLIG